jgi:hypothetical protein
MEWYYADEFDQQHSISDGGLAGLVAAGTIRPGTLLWNGTLTNWVPAIQLRPELFGSSVAPPVLTADQRRDIAYGGPGYPAAVPPTDPMAITALVLGLISLFCFPLLGIGAVICGHIARKRARESPVPTSADGLALAGLICGYLSLVVLAFIIVVYGFVIIAAIAGSASL